MVSRFCILSVTVITMQTKTSASINLITGELLAGLSQLSERKDA